MSLSTATFEFNFFRTQSCNTFIPDYIGYGKSSGKASEGNCKETATTIYKYLVYELNIPTNRIVIAGWSLGAAVAIDLASRVPLAGLIALSPFTSIDDMASNLLHVHLPVSKLLNCHFNNLSKISLISCPIFIAHGTNDQVIPFSMGQRVAKEATGSNDVRFIPISGANHNDIFTFDNPHLIFSIDDFIKTIYRNSLSS